VLPCAVLPCAAPAGVTVPGALAMTPSGRDETLAGDGAGAAVAGRVPAETGPAGITPAGGAAATPVVVRALPAAPPSAGPPSGPPNVAMGGLPPSGELDVEAPAADEERAPPDAGRSRSGEGSSG
jgi:hypothetical protein